MWERVGGGERGGKESYSTRRVYTYYSILIFSPLSVGLSLLSLSLVEHLSLAQYHGTAAWSTFVQKHTLLKSKAMGNADTKLNFRKAVIQLTTKTAPVDAADEQFWEQFWSESVTSVQVGMNIYVPTNAFK